VTGRLHPIIRLQHRLSPHPILRIELYNLPQAALPRDRSQRQHEEGYRSPTGTVPSNIPPHRHPILFIWSAARSAEDEARHYTPASRKYAVRCATSTPLPRPSVPFPCSASSPMSRSLPPTANVPRTGLCFGPPMLLSSIISMFCRRRPRSGSPSHAFRHQAACFCNLCFTAKSIKRSDGLADEARAPRAALVIPTAMRSKEQAPQPFRAGTKSSIPYPSPAPPTRHRPSSAAPIRTAPSSAYSPCTAPNAPRLPPSGPKRVISPVRISEEQRKSPVASVSWLLAQARPFYNRSLSASASRARPDRER